MKSVCRHRFGASIRKPIRQVALITAMASAGLLSPSAHAFDLVWFGGSGEWTLPANWSPIGPPGIGDRALINGGSAGLAVNQFVNGLSISGGSIGGTGNLAVSGLVSFTGGQIGGDGGQVIANGGLQISGAADKHLGYQFAPVSSGIVTNASAVWSGTGNIGNAGSGRLTNSASGTFDIQNDGTFTGGAFVNQGSLVKTIGAVDKRTYFNGTFNNAGSVNVQQGTLTIVGAGAHSGSFSTADAAWLEVTSDQSVSQQFNSGSSVDGNLRFIPGAGFVSFNPGSSYNTFRTDVLGGNNRLGNVATSARTGTLGFSGGSLTGPGNLIVSGLATFTGGSIGGDGGQVFANGGLQISGATDKHLGYQFAPVSSGIVNNASAVWSGAGNIGNAGSGRLTNSASGTFDIQNDANFTGGAFVNEGTLTKSVGAANGNQTTINGALVNTGTVNLRQGVLRVTSAFNNQGIIDVASSAQLQITNPTSGNAGTLQGNGTIQTAASQTLNNTGLISPGNSIGRLTIDGSLKSSGAASMKFELASLGSFDVLSVTGNAMLGGDIGVWDLGYTPMVGDSFVVMTFDKRLSTSTFSSLTLHGFNAGTVFGVTYHGTDVTLNVLSVGAVPEPNTCLMMLAGFGVIGGVIRRRLSS